jgi:hypothetical protein
VGWNKANLISLNILKINIKSKSFGFDKFCGYGVDFFFSYRELFFSFSLF